MFINCMLPNLIIMIKNNNKYKTLIMFAYNKKLNLNEIRN
jgi:hypothetical protein